MMYNATYSCHILCSLFVVPFQVGWYGSHTDEAYGWSNRIAGFPLSLVLLFVQILLMES